MTTPHGDQPSLPGLLISGFRPGGLRPFQSRDPPRSRSPPPSNLRSPPRAAPKPPPAPNPWSAPPKVSRIPLARRPYDPSYTWNRGGRVKELRIRFLARKFLHLWLRKAFGRVRLPTARAFRRRQLLRSAWRVWFQLYWDERKEWRLRLRAECHDRLRVWQRAFAGWKAFVVKRRVARAKIDLAVTHFNARLRVKVWLSWRQVAGQRASRRRAVLAFRAEWLLRRCLTRWRAAAEERAEERALEDNVRERARFWAKRRTWRRWRLAVAVIAEKRAKERRAEAFREAQLKGKVLRALEEYAGHRRHRAVMKHRADRFRAFTVTAAAFAAWHARWRRMVELQAFEGRMRELARRCRLRWGLRAIRRNVQLVREGQVRLATAVLHDEKRLKRKAFAALVLFLQLRQKSAAMKEAAEEQRRKALLRRCLSTWEKSLELREERSLAPQNQKAKQLRKLHLKRAAFASWRLFLASQRSKSAHMVLASQHFARKALPRCFVRWRLFAQLRRRRAAAVQLANDFRRRSLLTGALELWRLRCEAAAQERYQFRVAVLHDRSVVLARSFTVWRDKTECLLWDREKTEEAAEFERASLLCRYLAEWRRRASERVQEEIRADLADKHRRTAMLRSTMTAWRGWAVRRAGRKRAEEEASEWRKRRMKRNAYEALREVVRRKKTARLQANEMAHQKRLARLSELWPRFRRGVSLVRERRLATERARDHFQHELLSKVLFAWRTHTAQRILQRRETQRRLHEARLQLSRGLARRVLATWAARRDQCVLSRLAMTRARLHHEAKVRARVWRAWRSHVTERQAQRLRERQADWFNHVRLLGGAWRQWCLGLAERTRQHDLSVAAIVHWATALQRKSFRAWRLFVCAQRIQASREEEALGRYRSRLLLDGVRLWLFSADQVRLDRERHSLKTSLTDRQRALEAARKCATHWRQKIARRKDASHAARGPLRPVLPEFRPLPLPATDRYWRSDIEAGLRLPDLKTGLHPEARSQTRSQAQGNHHSGFQTEENHHILPEAGLRLPANLNNGLNCSSQVKVIPQMQSQTEAGPQLRARPSPRVPDFLRESLQKANLLSSSSSSSSLVPNFGGVTSGPDDGQLLPPSAFSLTPEVELRDVCDQLRRFREDRRRLKSLRAQLKRLSGEDATALKAALVSTRATVNAVNPDALVARAKELVQTLSLPP